MLSLYTQKEVCETRRRDRFPVPEISAGPWIPSDELGLIPNGTLWDSVSLLITTGLYSHCLQS